MRAEGIKRIAHLAILLARHGADGGVAAGKAGELSERDRFDRRPQPVGANLSWRPAMCLRHQLGYREVAQPPLTGSHATAEKCLELIGAGASQPGGLGDIVRGHFLAAADQRLAIGEAKLSSRFIENIEKVAPALETMQCFAR